MVHHRLAARIGAVFALLAGVAIASGAAIYLPYLLAELFSSVPLLVTISIVIFAVWVALAAWAAKSLWQLESRKVVPALVALLTAAFAVSLYLILLRPSHALSAPGCGSSREYEILGPA